MSVCQHENPTADGPVYPLLKGFILALIQTLKRVIRAGHAGLSEAQLGQPVELFRRCVNGLTLTELSLAQAQHGWEEYDALYKLSVSLDQKTRHIWRREAFIPYEHNCRPNTSLSPEAQTTQQGILYVMCFKYCVYSMCLLSVLYNLMYGSYFFPLCACDHTMAILVLSVYSS